ncbi:MAG: DUF1328 domain-containing protein [Oceanicaulis sp.]
MFGWALAFAILAVIAAVLGFGVLAGAAAVIAQWLFFIALALAVIAAVIDALKGRPPI